MEEGESKTTKDHETIKRWADQRGGTPARMKGTGDEDDAGILRINFPGFEEEGLEEIDWFEWFQEFDIRNLSFLYQEKTKEGRVSRFFKLVKD